MNSLTPRHGRADRGLKRVLPRPGFFGRTDSKGHSRFVLRILIILSHRSRKQREPPPSSFERCRRGGPLRLNDPPALVANSERFCLLFERVGSQPRLSPFLERGPFLPVLHGPTVNSNRLTVATALQRSTIQLAERDGRDKFAARAEPDPYCESQAKGRPRFVLRILIYCLISRFATPHP